MLDWQLSPEGLRAVGSRSTYHVIIGKNRCYLLDKPTSGPARRMFTPTSKSSSTECREMASRWDNEG